jgi:hypothetical protein
MRRTVPPDYGDDEGRAEMAILLVTNAQWQQQQHQEELH